MPQKTMKTCFTIPVNDQLNNNVVTSSSINNEIIKANVHENILGNITEEPNVFCSTVVLNELIRNR